MWWGCRRTSGRRDRPNDNCAAFDQLDVSHLLFFVQQNQFAALNVPKKDTSQIEGPSIANSYGFKVNTQNLQDAKALHEVSCTSKPLLQEMINR